MRRRDIALVIAVILAGTAVVGLRLPSSEQRLAAEADTAARRVKLASVPGSKLREAVTPRLRVLVTPEGVAVDGTAMVHAWSKETREAVRRAQPDADPLGFFERDVSGLPSPRDSEKELLIRPLLSVLEHARGLERLRDGVEAGDPSEPEASVLIDGDPPFSAVAPVLYTLAQGEHGQYFLVQAPGVLREIPLAVPTYRAHVGEYADVSAEITLGPDGLAVRIQGAAQLARGVEPDASTRSRPRGRSVRGRLVVDEDRRCPTAPGEKGAYDRARLERVLRLVHDRILVPLPPPGGESPADKLARALSAEIGADAVQIAPRWDTPWREIAEIAGIAAECGYSALQLTIPRGPPRAASKADCDEAVMASTLREGDADFFQR